MEFTWLKGNAEGVSPHLDRGLQRVGLDGRFCGVPRWLRALDVTHLPAGGDINGHDGGGVDTRLERLHRRGNRASPREGKLVKADDTQRDDDPHKRVTKKGKTQLGRAQG
eukprot:1186857-Prorocentrum_minimum.AAC.2